MGQGSLDDDEDGGPLVGAFNRVDITRYFCAPCAITGLLNGGVVQVCLSDIAAKDIVEGLVLVSNGHLNKVHWPPSWHQSLYSPHDRTCETGR